MRVAAAILGAGLLCTACVSAGPRFSPEIAASFAHQPMRHLETSNLELYYPADARDEALRVASRLGHCLETLRTYSKSQVPRPKLLLYLTSANFNNAYVEPQFFGAPQLMVVPLHETDELFNLIIEPGGEVADVSCHEAVHYVQLQQVTGLWRFVNLVGGDVLSPNVFTESWFLEGLAVHYEGRLGKDAGRPWNPIWHGLFDSGIAAERGRINPGYLQPGHRASVDFGGNYLIGQQFVDWLARTYGEDKLWELVDVQADSWIPPVGVTLRFKEVYGKSIGALFEDWTVELQRGFPRRERPANQRTLDGQLGAFARVAAAPDGTLAVVSQPRDEPVQLTIRGPDDAIRLQKPLRPILPERPFIASAPLALSGMTFSRDGRSLFFVVADTSETGDDENRLVQLDVETGEVLHTWGALEGMGGDLLPDGRSYVFTHLEGDTANLWLLHLDTGAREPLTRNAGRQSLGVAAVSPSGRRIAFPRWMGVGFDLFLLEDGAERQLTRDQRFNQSPRWVDEDHLVLVRDEAGYAQAEVLDVRSGEVRRVTDAPFVAFDPAPRPGNRLAFSNREGWSWTLDEVPLDGALPMTDVPRVIATPVPANAAPSEAQVTIERDEPYRALDHLLVPTLRMPLVLVLPTNDSVLVATQVAVVGSDRLGFHNYALTAGYIWPDHSNEVGLAYWNTQLAPWTVFASASRSQDADHIIDSRLDLSVSRSFWTTPLTFDLPILHRTTPGYDDLLVGPRLATAYTATDGSPYGGSQRGFAMTAAAQLFPRALGNDFDFGDLRGTLRIYLPQPIPRGSFNLSGVGRALPGAPHTLLRVGGFLPSGYASLSEPLTADVPTLALPTGVTFSEPLRGYEDHELHGFTATIGGADYNYPLIIDSGWASTLYVLPSFFVRQVDLNLFARVARIEADGTSLHRVVGASLTLETQIAGLWAPTLFVQYAQRFDDGLGPLDLFGLSF